MTIIHPKFLQDPIYKIEENAYNAVRTECLCRMWLSLFKCPPEGIKDSEVQLEDNNDMIYNYRIYHVKSLG